MKTKGRRIAIAAGILLVAVLVVSWFLVAVQTSQWGQEALLLRLRSSRNWPPLVEKAAALKSRRVLVLLVRIGDVASRRMVLLIGICRGKRRTTSKGSDSRC